MIANALLATTLPAAAVAVSVAVRPLKQQISFPGGSAQGRQAWRTPTSNLPSLAVGNGANQRLNPVRDGGCGGGECALLCTGRAREGECFSNRLVLHKGPAGGRVTKWPVSSGAYWEKVRER